MSNPTEGQSEAMRAQCVQFDRELADYLEGENRPEVLQHAQQCPFCNVILADLQMLRAQASSMLQEDPPPRVWANVRATLAAEGAFREPAPAWLAWLPQTGLLRYAAPFAALASLVLLSTLLLIQSHPQPPVTTTASNVTSAAGTTPAVAFTDADVRLEQAVSEMEKSYKSREKSFDPVMHASYQKGLDSLDTSIRECKASVSREPNNALAREYLLAAYEQKAAVLSAALEYDGQ